MALEIAIRQPDKKFDAQNLLMETLLTAMDIGDLLLNMVSNKAPDSLNEGTQSYEEFLRGAGKGTDLTNLIL